MPTSKRIYRLRIMASPPQMHHPRQRQFLSKRGAEHRATILREQGATVEVEVSNPVTWPSEQSTDYALSATSLREF